MAAKNLRFIHVNRYSPVFDDKKLAGKWFAELHSTDGTVWTISPLYKRKQAAIEWAKEFSIFAGLRMTVNPRD